MVGLLMALQFIFFVKLQGGNIHFVCIFTETDQTLTSLIIDEIRYLEITNLHLHYTLSPDTISDNG